MVNFFGKKYDMDNRGMALELQSVPYAVPKRHELWPTNGIKRDRSFYPPSVNARYDYGAIHIRWHCKANVIERIEILVSR